MSKGSSLSAQPPVDQPPWATQLSHVRKVGVLLLIACLVVSACLNVYLVAENLSVKKTFTAFEQERQSRAQFDRFMQRLLMDLQALAKTDKAVQELIEKYKYSTDPFAGK